MDAVDEPEGEVLGPAGAVLMPGAVRLSAGAEAVSGHGGLAPADAEDAPVGPGPSRAEGSRRSRADELATRIREAVAPWCGSAVVAPEVEALAPG